MQEASRWWMTPAATDRAIEQGRLEAHPVAEAHQRQWVAYQRANRLWMMPVATEQVTAQARLEAVAARAFACVEAA